MLTNPLRDRFGIVARLEFYNTGDLARIVMRSAQLLNAATTTEGATEIVRRARGPPRLPHRLLRRVRDYAQVKATGLIDAHTPHPPLSLHDVHQQTLDSLYRKMPEPHTHK